MLSVSLFVRKDTEVLGKGTKAHGSYFGVTSHTQPRQNANPGLPGSKPCAVLLPWSFLFPRKSHTKYTYMSGPNRAYVTDEVEIRGKLTPHVCLPRGQTWGPLAVLYLCRCQSIQVWQEPGWGGRPQVPGRKREAGKREGDDSDGTDGFAAGEEGTEGSHPEQPRYPPRCGPECTGVAQPDLPWHRKGRPLTQISWFSTQERWASPLLIIIHPDLRQCWEFSECFQIEHEKPPSTVDLPG